MTCRRSSPFPSRGDTARTSTGWPARPPRTPASSSCGRKRDSLLEDEQLAGVGALLVGRDRKSTRLNSSHSQISYAVFCLKKKKKKIYELPRAERTIIRKCVPSSSQGVTR